MSGRFRSDDTPDVTMMIVNVLNDLTWRYEDCDCEDLDTLGGID